MTSPIHVVHVLYRFAAGGLENVLVQLINGLPHEQFRHTVIALTTIDEAFSGRITRTDVEVIALNKPPGQPFALYPRMYRLLRRLRPDVVHSCNIAALEFMPVACMARVPVRIHAEHGWDVSDPDGSNQGYRRLRQLYCPFVHNFIAVSAQLHDYLRDAVHVRNRHLHLIANGVDTNKFRPREGDEPFPVGFPFDSRHRIIGSVGRLEPIKNHRLLVESFSRMAGANQDLRLVIIGAGPLHEPLLAFLDSVGLRDRAWLPGARSDVPELLRSFDCFVLPSLAEGTSCTLQEAMASALPIVATDVGGNARLLDDGAYGRLTPSNDVEAMVMAMTESMGQAPAVTIDVGRRARRHVCDMYSIGRMIKAYSCLFGGT